MSDDLEKREDFLRDNFLNYVVKTMGTTVRFRDAFIDILEEVGIDSIYLMGDRLEKEKYFSLVGDGKKVLSAERKIQKLKSQLIDVQAVCLLFEKSPRSMTGLHNATARLLSRLVDAADGFHSFFGKPLDEHYGFHYLKRGWNKLEIFEAEYAIMREILRDLLDPLTYREKFQNIRNLSIL